MTTCPGGFIGFWLLISTSTGIVAQPLPEHDFRLTTLTGVVEKGPCDSSLTLRLPNGTRYELDPKRSLLKVGSRGSYQGKVYPRISICQKYPWFDVDVGNQNRIAANQTQKETVVTYDGSTSIQLVASQAQLQQRLREASELIEQMPAGVLVSIGLRPTGVSSGREKWQLLANAATEIRKRDWRLLEKIQLHVISPNTPDGVIQRSPKGERNFPDAATFLIEWNRDNHPSS